MPDAASPPLVATVTFNPSVDLSFTVETLTPAAKLRCHDVRRDPGGGGINVARAVRRLGGDAFAIITAGGVAGTRLQALLAAEGLAHRTVQIAGETREDVTAEVVASGEQYRFVLPGPALSRDEAEQVLALARDLSPMPSVLVASGSLPPGTSPRLYARLARRARTNGLRFALDASGAALVEALPARPWLIKPNLAELEEASGRPLPDLESRIAACQALRERGAAIVALSMGGEGALLASDRGVWLATAPPVTPVSTVGAGDSFMAALVMALADGAPEPEGLRLAVAAGSAALVSLGTQLCHLDDVMRLAPIVCVEAIADAAWPRASRSARARVAAMPGPSEV